MRRTFFRESGTCRRSWTMHEGGRPCEALRMQSLGGTGLLKPRRFLQDSPLHLPINSSNSPSSLPCPTYPLSPSPPRKGAKTTRPSVPTFFATRRPEGTPHTMHFSLSRSTTERSKNLIRTHLGRHVDAPATSIESERDATGNACASRNPPFAESVPRRSSCRHLHQRCCHFCFGFGWTNPTARRLHGVQEWKLLRCHCSSLLILLWMAGFVRLIQNPSNKFSPVMLSCSACQVQLGLARTMAGA